MWKESMITKFVRERLSEKRFAHTIGVRNTAVKLAEIYGEDRERAMLAGLIHDCAKNMGDEEILSLVKESGYEPDWIEENSPQLLHGRAAAVIALREMGLEDEAVLNAVIYHTTGRTDMTTLEKIVYVADYIEPSRNFPGVDELRKAAFTNIDGAMLMALENTIRYVLEKHELLHTDTIDARNHMLIVMGGKSSG
ncbi:MAG: bis(5'-nucleosyl)-tetraphosphatase (symmetrical) YqeK [Bacillota bacterium]|nr:bis(5'-nucleosyl)-tetraphosphatase (symmetrical) YqeK [Bacillota bacterium]